MVGFLALLMIALLLLCIFLVKVEEHAGLNGFERRIIGNFHGSLIEVTPLKNTTPQRASLVFIKALCIALVSYLVISVAAILLASSVNYGINNAINCIFPVIVTAAAFSTYQSRGFMPALFGSIGGFILASLLVLTTVVSASIELGRPLVDQILLNGLIALFGTIGAAAGVALMPSQCQFRRIFADGFADTIWVSNRSSAYRSFIKLSRRYEKAELSLTQAALSVSLNSVPKR